MTETTTPTPAPKPPQASPAPPKAEPAERKRYAAYDLTFARFTGGVQDARKDAQAIVKGIRDAGRDAEVREV